MNLDDPAAYLAAARGELPWWLPLGQLAAYWAFTFLVALAAAVLGVLSSYWLARPSSSDHWTEKARRLHPANAAMSFNLLAIPLISMLFANHSGLGLLPSRTVAVIGAALAFLAIFLVWRWFLMSAGHIVVGRFSILRSLALYVLFTAFAWVMPAILCAVSPKAFNWTAMYQFLAGAVIVVLYYQWGLEIVARALGILKPAPDWVTTMAEELGQEMGTPLKRAYRMPFQTPLAYALPTARSIALSDGVVELLTRPQLRAMMAHELAHLSDPWPARFWQTIAVVAFASLGMLPAVYHAEGLLFVLMVVVCVLAPASLAGAIARDMEKRADSIAAAHSDPVDYARALETFYRANLSPAVMSGEGHIHPNLYDRMLAVGVQPDFPRPAAPDRNVAFVGVALAVIFFGGAQYFAWHFERKAPVPTASPSMARLAGGLLSSDLQLGAFLLQIADEKVRSGDWAGATPLFQGAAVLRPDDPQPCLRTAVALAVRTDWGGAESWVREAWRRQTKEPEPLFKLTQPQPKTRSQTILEKLAELEVRPVAPQED